ncbi:MAG TPA: Tm-1-like ATP-binding domain-containing protein [Streptosporangiaceae bacterium]|nr:Tm-1-like ATP-binding domain-containing protein [Streptosporangiaceae bacterium]
MAAVALIGTLDTKGPDFTFLAGRLRDAGAEVIVIDVGTGEPDGLAPDIDGEAVAAAAGTTRAELRAAADRGRAVTAMGRGAAAVVADLVARGRVGGVLAAGGSGGSSIAAQVMAGLPVGLPKLLVSTMASGDVSPYVGAKDVCVMYSVVDVAGINRISRLVLGNAAAAMAGMVAAQEVAAGADSDDRPLIAASMFGVTTPAVETARARLAELGYEVLVFHATGAGGRALEALAEARLVSGVLDLTTTELADDLVGGVLSAGPGRLTAAGAAGVPQVIAPGALDMVNFGPPATVPGQFSGRLFFEHNPTVTLMRTTAQEMAELGTRIGRKAAAATGPAEVFWPERGISALDSDGQPFWDPAADAACLAALDRALTPAGRVLRRVDAHINDPRFATAMADRLHQMITEGA